MSKDQLFAAFKAGENWGVTYSTWFTPDEGDDRKKFEEWYEQQFTDTPLLEKCMQLVKEGYTLNALKEYKDGTGCSLTEARNVLGI